MGTKKQPIIIAKNVSKSFEGGRVQALRDVNLTVESGEFMAIMGPSGSGKSTLLSILGALEPPEAGEILFEGRTLFSQTDLADFRSRKIGFVFQAFHLIPTLTALENVQIPMMATEVDVAERSHRAVSLLDEFGLHERLHFRPHQLSGGERQRVAIARALSNSPEVILADEPTGNLDTSSAEKVLEALVSANQEHGVTVIVVTHDQSVAFHARRVLQLRDGRIQDAAVSRDGLNIEPKSPPKGVMEKLRFVRLDANGAFSFKRIPFSRSDRASVERIMKDDLFPLEKADMINLSTDGLLAFTPSPLEEGDLMALSLSLQDQPVPLLCRVLGLTALEDRGFQVRGQFVEVSEHARDRLLAHLDTLNHSS
ncbi:MAG: ABC transporter ATP-binding protein [Nitrospirae bacterium]|nr:ABC transporter ATP-binding protein [Nitrospirota bacterium]